MSNLSIGLVTGAFGTTPNAPSGLDIAAFPASDFSVNPQRGYAYPNASPTASGTTTDGSTTTLTGLSAVAYWVAIDDPAGTHNWFYVPASYIGGTYIATLPYAIPAAVTGTQVPATLI